jgi:hypothetical protein
MAITAINNKRARMLRNDRSHRDGHGLDVNSRNMLPVPAV